jgi:uncharacterized membrane protein YkvA (DUF1232 family)
MLHALKQQLKVLAQDPCDPFHICIRRRVGKRATRLLENRLKQLILVMPDAVERVHALWSKFPDQAPAKRAGGYLLTYLYHPKDFLAEEELGFFGYLDDAYFSALVYEFVLGELENRGRLLAQDKAFLEDLEGLKAAARLVIPAEAEKIETMLKEIKMGANTVFESAFAS